MSEDSATIAVSEDDIRELLSSIEVPAVGGDVVALGVFAGVEARHGIVFVKLNITRETRWQAPEIDEQVRAAVGRHLTGDAATEVRTDWVWPADLRTEVEGDAFEAMHDVVDPELGINVVDLGLIYSAPQPHGANRVMWDMTLTSAACPLTDVIEEQSEEALKDIASGSDINWVWMPPWGPENITEDGREQLRALGFNI
jgi:metal-sulfur cluster biosynthetic enzyme